MKLNSDGFFKHLSQKSAPIYLIEGDEPLLIEEAIDALHNKLKNDGFLERISFQVDAKFELSDLNSLTQNFSLFSEKKRVELQCGEKTPAAFNNWVVDFCGRLQDYQDLCLVIKTPKLSGAEKKSKWVTAIEKAGIVLTLYEVEINEFPRWLDGRLFQAQIKLSADARALFIEQTEGNLLAAIQVIKKLSLMQSKQMIELSDLEPLLADGARYDLFDLSRHVLLGDLKRSLKILEHLVHESEPVLVLWVLAKELKALLTIHTKKNTMPLQELYRSLQIWDKRQREVEAGLRRLSATKLSKLLAFCAEIDLSIKGLKDEDPWGMLNQLIVKMAKP